MIALRGIKVTAVGLDNGEEPKTTGTYVLMSTKDAVLAKQEFNTYSSDMKVELSADTQKKRMEFLECLKTDVELTLGLGEEA